jgi:NADP-dependent 3-hydroxy acid dehydrogenase YdfG
VQALVDAAVSKFGRLDILINNAGFGLLKPFTDSSVQEIDSQIDVNVKGVCYGCYAALPQMLKQGSGHIINIGSVASVRHFPRFAVYTGTKFAVLGFTRSLYEEVRAQGIRMNVICPAAVNTEFLDVAGFTNPPWKAEDMLQPEDIAELVYTCLTLPPRVQVESIIVWPTCQATA